jgi:hypothetical protein
VPQRILVILIALVLVGGAYWYFASGSGVDTVAAEVALETAEEALARGDTSAVLTATAQGLEADPGSYPLAILRVRAFCLRTRYTDALAAAEVARDAASSRVETEEVEFWIARAHAGRFLDAGERADFNRAEATLRESLEDPVRGAAAKTLLGAALVKSGRKDEGRPLLEAGLATPAVKTLLGDTARLDRFLREP